MITESCLKIKLVALTTIMFCSCLRNELSFPKEPHIEFVKYTPSQIYENQSFNIVLHFKDGDGDIGTNNQQDTSKSFTLIIDRVSGTLRSDTIWGYLPDLTPDSKNPSIQGEIYYKLEGGIPITDPDAEEFEVVQLYAQIMDRNKNKSNLLKLPELKIYKVF